MIPSARPASSRAHPLSSGVPVTVSAPGKLILMGEHAVVYGHPALVAAVDRRLEARLSPAPGRSVEIHLRSLGHRERTTWAEIVAYARRARERWRRYAEAPGMASFASLRGTDPAHVVKVGLGEAAAFLGERAGPGLRLEVTSALPIGSGFGSSAALAAAVVGGYTAFRGNDLSPEELEGLVLEVERRQHGMPSGVDGATVIRGGLVWARLEPGGGLTAEPLPAGSSHLDRMRVFDTGTPAETTGAVVAAVRERVEREPGRLGRALEEMGATTRRFRRALLEEGSDPRTVAGLIHRFEAGLEELGVVPEPVRSLVRRVEERGAAAKVSGAGALTAGPGPLPGAGTLLVYGLPAGPAAGASSHRESPDPVAGLPEVDVELGGPGLRREEGGT